MMRRRHPTRSPAPRCGEEISPDSDESSRTEVMIQARADSMGRRISLFPVLAINFLGTLGLSIVIPFMVFLVTRLGGNGLLYGVLSAAYPAFQLVGAPVLGRWSDLY